VQQSALPTARAFCRGSRLYGALASRCSRVCPSIYSHHQILAPDQAEVFVDATKVGVGQPSQQQSLLPKRRGGC
jgi:hypothetical protein